jgi:RimJ/RimL family protein N-acetyltransferase
LEVSVRIRPAVESDLERIIACRSGESISSVTEEEYRARLAARSYRPEWTWIAEEGARILACAVWWGFPEGERPLELDCLDVDPTVTDPIGVCAELVGRVIAAVPAGDVLPTYQLILPNRWRDDAGVARAVRWRLDAVSRAGLCNTIERLRFDWTPELTLPPRSTRLVFAEELDDERWIDLFSRVAEGSLDTATRREVAQLGPERAARKTLELYAMAPARRDWWRVARAGGDLVGFAMPSRNESGHVVAYLGVVPEHRGRGYVHDVLAEITHVLAAADAPRIVADVDATNAPMVAAFERAGYRNFAVRVVAAAPPRRVESS